MEEDILKIMGDILTITDYMAGIDGVPEAAKKIKERMVKFMNWFQKGTHQFGRIENIDECLYVNFSEGSKHKYTLEEVYDWWLNNIIE